MSCKSNIISNFHHHPPKKKTHTLLTKVKKDQKKKCASEPLKIPTIEYALEWTPKERRRGFLDELDLATSDLNLCEHYLYGTCKRLFL